MATELLPVVDLRALSQSDLDALAAASAHALEPRSCPDADPLPPLSIDRAVFNESAGSRKQTFSRLRLAAASSSSSSSPSARPTSSSSAPQSAAHSDPDSRIIAYHLRRLFAPDDPSLAPPPELPTLNLTESPPSPPPDPDRATTNSKGISVDLVRLAGMMDPYDPELRRRTAGMASETELMGFISSVAGQWATQRRRRKFVDASFFGDHLPSGWKLLLGLKRKERKTWVHCFSYVSPKGTQFDTCKEVSAYLMSLLGYPEDKTVLIQHNSTGQHALCADDGGGEGAGFLHQIGTNANALPVASITFPSYSGDLKDKDERSVDTVNGSESHKSNLTSCDQTSYVQHHLSSHEMNSKRRRTGKFGEPLVGQDGKYECPICHQTFTEQARYFGHVGAHAKYQGMTPEAFLDKISSAKVVSSSMEGISFNLQELTGSPQQNNKISAGEGGFQDLGGSNERGNSSKVKELFNTNCLDSFNQPNKDWHRPEDIPHITYAASTCNVTYNSNGQPDGSLNGFSEATVFGDQSGSHHVFRPNSFGTADPYQDQITGHGMAALKHAGLNNTLKAKDVNLNSGLDTISFPIASANNASPALNEANQSSFTTRFFGGSFNNSDPSSASSCSASTNKIGTSLDVVNKASVAASTSFNPSYENNSGAGKANSLGNKNNAVLYQSNMGMRPVSSEQTKADCFASRSVHSKNSGKECTSNTKERIDGIQNRASNEAGFGVEAYNNIFGGVIHERGFTQSGNNFTHMKPNVSIYGSLPESNMLKGNNLTKEADVNFMKGSSVNRSDINYMKDSNRPISNNESNVSKHTVIGKSSNEVQNRHNGYNSDCVPLATARTSQNVTQANFGVMSPMIRPFGDVPISSTTQDQCDLQLGFGAQKQQLFSGYGELRSNAAGSPQMASMPRNNSFSAGFAQYGSVARTNTFPTGSPHQFGSLARPNAVTAAPSQFVSTARHNSVPPDESSQFGGMARPNSVPHSQFQSMTRPNSVLPADSSQFGNMARPNSEPSQFASMPQESFMSRTEPTLVLGYAPQMGNGPPIGWDLSLSKVTGGMITCLCVYCHSQFHHFGPYDGQHTGPLSFICPACKDKISGRPNMPNNGSWRP